MMRSHMAASDREKRKPRRDRKQLAFEKLKADGVDVESLRRYLAHLDKLPMGKRRTLLGNFSAADRIRIKALPTSLRAQATLIGKPQFLSFIMRGLSQLPPTERHRLANLFRVTNQVPLILGNLAEAVENSAADSPEAATFSAKLTWIVDRIKADSKREHYNEIATILDRNPDALKQMVARERIHQKKLSSRR